MLYPVKGLLEVYEDMAQILLMLQVFLAEDPEIEYLFCGAPSGSKTCLLFWTTSRFQKNETGSCHNKRNRRFAAEYSFVVLK